VKARRRPKWSLLFSNLKSGVVGITYTDRTRNKRESKLTLVTGFVPNNLQLKQAPNNPTNVEQMTAFDLDIRQWVTFDLESIEEYKGLISYTAPRKENEQRREEVSSGEESRNERPEETSNARKFRSRFEPET
jgi:hypothetical protein